MVTDEEDPQYGTFYAFTYKRNLGVSQKAQKLDYALVLDHIQKHNCHITACYYELDSNENWHIHGIASFPLHEAVSYKKLSVKSFTSKWRRIYDYSGWEAYIKKDQYHDDESVDIPDPPKILLLKKSLFISHK
jgi:hypothetical protein